MRTGRLRRPRWAGGKHGRKQLVATVLALAALISACTTPTPATTPESTPLGGGQARASPPLRYEDLRQAANAPATTPTGTPTPTPTEMPTPYLPTATLPGTPEAQAGRYENPDLGVSFRYPRSWVAEPGEEEASLMTLIDFPNEVIVFAGYGPMPPDATLESIAQGMRDAVSTGVSGVEYLGDEAVTLDDGREAWRSEFSMAAGDGSPVRVIIALTARSGRLFTLLAFGEPDGLEQDREQIDEIIGSITLATPRLYGIPREEALFLSGGESTNPRDYDPAVSGGDDLVFSGLVSFNPQLEVVPDLAESWDVSPDGTLYTFYLRENARFHDGRPVTAQDVVYSWERAADPETDSDTVLTYLGDIVGVRDKHEGKVESIGGLKAIDERTLQVTIDAPKPYFVMKLAYGTAAVVDRANVESGPEWYRTPNGSGPYKLIRWDPFELRLYERNEDFYLDPPEIRYIVMPLFSGIPIRLYETGDVDIAGVGTYDAERVRDPEEPLNANLREGVSMCTSFVTFDVTEPPFEDPKVRQAFALAVDKQRYIDVVLRGISLPAHGVYPPAMPGYDMSYEGLPFDPELARQRLAESSFGGPENLPPIVFTSGGFGSDVDSDVAALAQMWQASLGVTIEVENLEPDKFFDKLHDGEHGQLFSYGWCADYPDPENFADVLFHSDAQQNLGRYSNAELDAVLEAARVERDVGRRIGMYQQAERMIVEDAAGIFLNHGLSFVLVKPYIEGYALTPIAVPIERYLSIDKEKMGE
ncbi:MAG TPA: peptide ABC transporter substrate-binding protein [Anaerolineae bacterium]|nr:peptide ABC transporter substrate-binding protein [Anaerolineae bacterium]